MTRRTVEREREPGAVEVRYRPLYARMLGLRHLHPGGVLCFVYLEGAVALSLLLALAELVSWWVVLILPVSVALMVKVNDLVAGAVARSAARTPELERERLRREVSAFMPVVGRATVAAQGQQGRATGITQGRDKHATVATQGQEGRAVAQGQEGRLAARGQERCAVAQGQERRATQGQEDREPANAGEDLSPDAGEAAAAGQRNAAGGYAAAGRYLDAAWRQHAYAMAHHSDHAGQTSQRERQSATRRYE
jgi:hypothetical protein